MKYSDKEIVEHLKSRKTKAVSYLVSKYLPMIKYMALDYKYSDGNVVITGTESDAEDVFQEALYIIIKKIDAGEFELFSKFSTFLYAVCKNLLKLKLSQRLYVQRFKDESSDIAIEEIEDEETNEDTENQKKFDHYIEQLSPICKEILELFWLDMTNFEIAQKLGNTVKYITKRKSECKQKLIDLIIENPDDI